MYFLYSVAVQRMSNYINYALNFIFNIRLAAFSSSVLSQLYPSSLTMPTFSAQFFLSPVVLYFHAVLFFIIIFVRLSSLSFFFFFWSYLLNTMSFLVLSHCLISLFLPPLEHSGVLAVTLTSIGVAGTGMDLILSEHWGDFGNKRIFNYCKFSEPQDGIHLSTFLWWSSTGNFISLR